MPSSRKEYIDAYYQRNKDSYKDKYILRRHGLTQDQYTLLLEGQDYKCAICKVDFEEIGRKRTHIDHCHRSGKIRAILCNTCNQALGLLKDDTNLLQRAITYLEYHSA